MSNLEFWNKVSTTDPKHTKKVTLGRSFTAIDPMYQVMKATEAMGIAGSGWGFNVQEVVFLPTDQVAIRVRVWKGDKDSYVEQWGQNGLYMDKANTKPDTDCMKKATTDGLTKALTYFGFNADVLLGKFDDNKYVEALKKEGEANADSEAIKSLSGNINKLFDINKDKGAEVFKAWWGAPESEIERNKLKELSIDEYNIIIKKKKDAVAEFIKLKESQA